MKDLAYICDECGRPMAKAHRVHKGLRYCATCYQREFKPGVCPRCGSPARLLRSDPDGVCRRCELDQPCARCGKTGYKVAKLTPYGPVCGSCAHYFRKPKKCVRCGVLTTRFRLLADSDGSVICERCAKVGYGTCRVCHRHRLLEMALDGRMLCKSCRLGKENPCSVCGKSMPAARGNMCEECYWRDLLERRMAIDQVAFRSTAIRDAFDRFGHWLRLRVGANKAAITINRYFPFFLEADSVWGNLPCYDEMVKQFGPEGLRRVRLVIAWAKEMEGLVVDPVLREAESERRRIEQILRSVPEGTTASTALEAYRVYMAQRVENGRTSIKSMRLALRAAASLMQEANREGGGLPDQSDLDRYLGRTPGQSAAVSGFVVFLNKRYGLELARKPDSSQRKRLRQASLERALIRMMREGDGGEAFEKRWISAALAYFHGVRVSTKLVRDSSVTCDIDGGISITYGNDQYWIPVCTPDRAQLGCGEKAQSKDQARRDGLDI